MPLNRRTKPATSQKAQKISRSLTRSSQEPVHDPDAGLQGGQRDALVGAVEHGVVVVALGQHQRGEAVAGQAEPGELFRVGPGSA